MRVLTRNMTTEQSRDFLIKNLQRIQNFETLSNILQNRFLYDDSSLETEIFGLKFSNPVGVAAGFDKNAKVVLSMASFGYGYVEVGTVTPSPQEGNQRPRMFKLEEDNAIINRLGFNGDGMKKIKSRLENYDVDIPIGVNIGKMNSSDHKQSLEDYKELTNHFGELPSYYVLNVSCPNTPDRYDEQTPQNLRETIKTVKSRTGTPVLIKVSPDENVSQLNAISRVVNELGVNGIVATNTTEKRDMDLNSDKSSEYGGLSGEPLRPKSNRVIRHLYSKTDVPIIGVGGVEDGRTAYEKIVSGSSVVQLYTGIVYNGLSSAYRINRQLSRILDERGFDTIEDAVGADCM